MAVTTNTSLTDPSDRPGVLKVWSVIVTVLGDIAQIDPKTEIIGPVLTDVLARIGIQPEAVRVALHRLRRDDWIESRKVGRISYLRLTAKGLSETASVADRVFAPLPPAPDHWCLVVAPPHPAVVEPLGSAFPLGRGLAIAPGPLAALQGQALAAEIDVNTLPDWVRLKVEAGACDAEFAALLQDLAESAPTHHPSGDMDRFAKRTHILHDWRRLVLRADPVALRLLGPETSASRCRTSVHQLLQSLPRPDPGTLTSSSGQSS